MSVKNKDAQISLENPGFSRSLRLRVALWYSILVTLALIIFAALIWGVTTTILGQSTIRTVRAEARLASAQVKSELLSIPPYWPPHIVLSGLDAYKEPGVVVEIVDIQGKLRYDSEQNPTLTIPVTTNDKQVALAGQSRDYQTTISGQKVQVAMVPIYAPSSLISGTATPGGEKKLEASTTPTPVIGMLLVTKSLDEVNTTLFLVQTLVFSVGGVTLLIALLSSWAITARVLSPLAQMAKTARTIAVATRQGTRIGNLRQRVDKPKGRDEMAQVIEAFNEMLNNLERATQAQRRFIADASHELRAPLTTIQGNLAFLQRYAEELPAEERHTMLADAHTETLGLAQLVEELLMLARADASVDTIPLTPNEQDRKEQLVELDRVVLQLVRQLRGRLSTEGPHVQLQVGAIEPVRVPGNEERIRRILLILLDNALKYTALHEKNEAGTVTVSLQRKEDKALLYVEDTGIGIDPDDLPHIFDRFYRADRARSSKGTGLGLSIAQTLVEQVNGGITVESTPGKGSTFTLWFPLSS